MTKEMPAKYRQGDDFLRMLARAYKSNLCRGEWGDFETQKPLTLAFGWKLSNFDSFFEKLRTGKKYERGTTDTGARTEVKKELRTIS